MHDLISPQEEPWELALDLKKELEQLQQSTSNSIGIAKATSRPPLVTNQIPTTSQNVLTPSGHKRQEVEQYTAKEYKEMNLKSQGQGQGQEQEQIEPTHNSSSLGSKSKTTLYSSSIDDVKHYQSENQGEKQKLWLNQAKRYENESQEKSTTTVSLLPFQVLERESKHISKTPINPKHEQEQISEWENLTPTIEAVSKQVLQTDEKVQSLEPDSAAVMGMISTVSADQLQPRLKSLWDRLNLPVTARLGFLVKYTEKYHVIQLQSALEEWEEAESLISQREELLFQVREFERVNSDPRRFFIGLSTARLKEAQHRKKLLRKLQALGVAIEKKLEEIKARFKDDVLYGENAEPYIEKMRRDYTDTLLQLEEERMEGVSEERRHTLYALHLQQNRQEQNPVVALPPTQPSTGSRIRRYALSTLPQEKDTS